MSLRIVNKAAVVKASNITRALSTKFSSRVPNPDYPQGANVAGSTNGKRNDDDVVSRRIRESLDNDDGRDYGEGDEGGRWGEGDVSAEKAKKGARKTAETAFNAAGAVAEGMEQTWGAVKETTEKLKDAMLGDEHERAHNDRAADDRLRKDADRDSKWRA